MRKRKNYKQEIKNRLRWILRRKGQGEGLGEQGRHLLTPGVGDEGDPAVLVGQQQKAVPRPDVVELADLLGNDDLSLWPYFHGGHILSGKAVGLHSHIWASFPTSNTFLTRSLLV